MAEQLQGPFLGPFTGIDTSNPAKSIEGGKATILHNCVIDDTGAVVRRGGTLLVDARTPTTLPSLSVRVLTQSGAEYTVSVNGLNIEIQAWDDARTSTTTRPATPGPLLVKTNVFKTTPAVLNFTVINDVNTRLLIFTGNHPVIQISFNELRTSFTFDGVNRYTALDTLFTDRVWGDTVLTNYLFKDESYLPLSDLTRSPSSIVFNPLRQFVVSAIPSSTAVRMCTVTHISWQWWAEAERWYGRDLVQTRSRTNVTAADQTITVPPELTTDADPRYKASQQHQLLLFNAPKLPQNTLGLPVPNPTTVNEWGMSSGSRHVPGTTSQLTPTDDFVTFGTTEPVGTISTLWFVCIRALRFNGGRGIAADGNNIQPFFDKRGGFVSYTSPHLPMTSAVNLWRQNIVGDETVLQSITTLGQTATHFSVNRGNMSLPYDTEVLLVNGTLQHLGSSAIARYFGADTSDITGLSAVDGYYVPVPGIGYTSDYKLGLFHTNGAMFANRLVLVNPANAVDQLSVSDTNKELWDFQVTDALEGLATDPFNVSPVTNVSSTITALQVWQNNLFVFTRSEVYAVTAGEAFSSTSYGVERVSTYGCYNQQSVTLTNLSILYLNELGVFDLLTKANTSDYGSFERSTPVRQLFTDPRIRDYENNHWLFYDENTNKLYVGLRIATTPVTTSSPTTATKLLVLDLYWNAWSTWSTAGSNIYQQPFQVNTHVCMWVAHVLVALDAPDHLDFIQVTDSVLVSPPLEEHLIYVKRTTYQPATNPVTPGLDCYSSVPAVDPTTWPAPVDGVPTWFSDDFLVRPDNVVYNAKAWQRNILIDDLLYGGEEAPTLNPAQRIAFVAYVRHRRSTFDDVLSYAQSVNLLQTSAGVYTPVGRPGFPTMGTQYYIGIPYRSVYSSPVFNFASLGRLKRLSKLHLLWGNRDTAAFNQLYHQTPGMLQRNAAFVTVSANYTDYNTPEITNYLTRNLDYAASSLQTSIPLLGYGCDFQFHVSSVGAEPFTMTGYEFDVKPQSSKRYVRGDN